MASFSARAPAPSHPSGSSDSTLARFGTAVGIGSAAALACTVPATLRLVAVLGVPLGLGRAWPALGASALGPMILAVLALRGAREGLRHFAGPGARVRVFGVALWLTSTFVGFSMLGSLLRATTHQHALAGVTFAFAALGMATGAGLGCARLVSIIRARSHRAQWAVIGGCSAAALLALAWVGMRFVSAIAHDPSPSPAAAMVVDVLAFALAALFVSWGPPIAWRAVAYVGPPVAIAMAAAGIAGLHDDRVNDAIVTCAPAFAQVGEAVSGR